LLLHRKIFTIFSSEEEKIQQEKWVGRERIKGGDGSDVFLAYHQYLRTKSLVALLDSHGDDATLPELSGETRGQKAI